MSEIGRKGGKKGREREKEKDREREREREATCKSPNHFNPCSVN